MLALTICKHRPYTSHWISPSYQIQATQTGVGGPPDVPSPAATAPTMDPVALHLRRCGTADGIGGCKPECLGRAAAPFGFGAAARGFWIIATTDVVVNALSARVTEGLVPINNTHSESLCMARPLCQSTANSTTLVRYQDREALWASYCSALNVCARNPSALESGRRAGVPFHRRSCA